MYNRYIGQNGAYYPIEEAPNRNDIGRQPPPHHSGPDPGDSIFGGIASALKSILPDTMDTGDLLLLLILLLMYIETKDEETLITLIVLAILMFKQ